MHVIEKMSTQVIEKMSTQVIEKMSTQVIEKMSTQVMEKMSTQVMEKIDKQVIEKMSTGELYNQVLDEPNMLECILHHMGPTDIVHLSLPDTLSQHDSDRFTWS